MRPLRSVSSERLLEPRVVSPGRKEGKMFQVQPPSLPFFPKGDNWFAFGFWMFVAWGAVTFVGIMVGWWMNIRKAGQHRKKLEESEQKTAQPAVAGPPGQDGSPKPYTLDDLRADLLNPSLSIEEILPKCEKLDPADIQKVVSGLDGDEGRKAQRLAWFAEMAKTNKVGPLVKPPPVKVVVKATLEICRYCADKRAAYRNRNYTPGLFEPRPVEPTVYCNFCGGKGYFTVQRG